MATVAEQTKTPRQNLPGCHSAGQSVRLTDFMECFTTTRNFSENNKFTSFCFNSTSVTATRADGDCADQSFQEDKGSASIIFLHFFISSVPSCASSPLSFLFSSVYSSFLLLIAVARTIIPLFLFHPLLLLLLLLFAWQL